MRKSLFAFVVLAILASAVPASAQSIRWGYIPQTPDGWYYKIQGDQVGMLTADNLGMVRDLTNQLRRSEIRSLSDDLRWNGVAYGLQTARGFYPMYDRNRRPMSQRKATIIYSAAGSGIGAIVGAYGGVGGRRNTVVGAISGGVIGGVIGALTHRRHNDDVVVTPPSQGREGVRVGRDGIPVAVGTRPNPPSGGYQPVSSPVQQGGDWRVRNHSGFKVELWDGERFVILLQPGQIMSLSNPDGIRGVMLIPSGSGRIEQRDASIKASRDFDGWDLLAPSVP